MKKLEIPLLKLPTTIVLIDDNKLFLNSMTCKLSEKYLLKAYCNTSLALEELSKKSLIKKFFLDAFEQANSKEIDIDIKHPIFDYNRLSEIVYSSDRFADTSVIVVDFCMPGQINGIELCSRLSEYPYRKTILTGNADNKIAVDAFNNRIIDRYITKDANNIIEELTELIDCEIVWFFNNISKLAPGWNVDRKNVSSEFSSIFNMVLEKNKICEYYQVGDGEYLMLDDEANIFWFVLQSEENFKYFQQTAEYNEAPEKVIELLNNKSHMIYLYSEYEKSLSVEYWSEYLFPVQGTLDGSRYTIIKEKSFSLKPEKIKSYKDYREGAEKVFPL